MSLYKGTYLIAGSGYVEIEKIIDQKLRERDEKRYYIGSIIIDTENINPSDYLGFGTWEYFGEGKCLVGVDAGQAEFNKVMKTGGSKIHSHGNGNLAAAIEITWNGQNIIKIGNYQNRPMATNIAMKGLPTYYNENTNTTSGCRVEGSTSNSSTLQPYITVYMWRRTD